MRPQAALIVAALLALSGAASALQDPMAGRKLLQATGLAQALSTAQAQVGDAEASSLAQSAASSDFGATAAAQTFARVATSSPSSAVDIGAAAIASSYARAKAVAATAAHAFFLPSVEVQVLANTWEQCLAKAICLAPENAGVAIAIAFSDALAVDRATCGASCQASAFAQATARALALAVQTCGCSNPSVAVAQAVAELGPSEAHAFLEALALASTAAGIKLPACIFPISCVYIAPVIVSYICAVPVRVVFEECATQPKVIIICGKAGLPVRPEQATSPAKRFLQGIGDAIKAKIQSAEDAASKEGVSGGQAAPEAEKASEEVQAGGDVAAKVGASLAQRVGGLPAPQAGQEEQPQGQQEASPAGGTAGAATQGQTQGEQPTTGTQSLAEALRQRGQAAKPVPTGPSEPQAAIVAEPGSQQGQQRLQGQQGQTQEQVAPQQVAPQQVAPQQVAPQGQGQEQAGQQGQQGQQGLTQEQVAPQQVQAQKVPEPSADVCASICAGYWQGVSQLSPDSIQAIQDVGCNPGAEYCAKPRQAVPTTGTTAVDSGRPAPRGRGVTLPSAGTETGTDTGSGSGSGAGPEDGGTQGSP
ncbi:hypothetical protein C2E20_1029 [Micractinium conductrix]|uniref:Uncharacterized protein n=1 Tax=Micractinium conductrix TaxID=554055 RepID=A0A2P6VNX5_9CHLO|nr:hypothetical protein C2E20_1029 [Micractinium conductrix]|eukprot:PSC75803.1 hypothetical protein C2E20_1029 [Micractinium conductrix]